MERKDQGDGMDQIVWGKHSYGDMKIVGGTKGIVTIGKYSSLGENITAFMSHDHPTQNISTFPFGRRNRQDRRLEVVIGNDVFIGSHTVIFREVTVGDGAVIGAYSKITKDVPPYSVVVGDNRIIRKRFSDKDIEFLLKLKWWDFEDEEVEKIIPTLCSSDIKELRRIYGKS